MTPFDAKAALSESDICATFITPALHKAGWDETLQIRREVSFTKGRIIVRGKLDARGQATRADYVLHYRPNIPLAGIEAKDASHSIGDGMQQALDYAGTLDVPFVFSSNGHGFLFPSVYLRDVDPEDEADWPRQHEWLAQKLNDFHRVFSARVRALDLDAYEARERSPDSMASGLASDAGG